jgi:hypothetical protein
MRSTDQPSSLREYIFQTWRYQRLYPNGLAWSDVVRSYPAWRECIRSGSTPLADCRPWITFAATRYLRRMTHTDMHAFEYGAGGSTLFLAAHVGKLSTVEHDRGWAKLVKAELGRRNITNVHLSIIEPEADPSGARFAPEDPALYQSSAERYSGLSFERYVRSIDAHADGSLDLVLIDGRSRPACFVHALTKVAPGGVIMWDNTDRYLYQPAMLLAPTDFEFLDFPGPSPYVNFFTRTSAWIRRR